MESTEWGIRLKRGNYRNYRNYRGELGREYNTIQSRPYLTGPYGMVLGWSERVGATMEWYRAGNEGKVSLSLLQI